jgi:nitrogen fixation protein NifU and related proteins
MEKALNEDLYHDAIIEWSKRTGHTGHLKHADKKGTVSNPLCGDQVTVELRMDGETIKSIAFQVRGCLLCRASSYQLAELAEGLSLEKIIEIRNDLDLMFKTNCSDPAGFPESLRLFFPVRLHKSRHSCVLLPYDAVTDALSTGCTE